jgi:hypothetical protein
VLAVFFSADTSHMADDAKVRFESVTFSTRIFSFLSKGNEMVVYSIIFSFAFFLFVLYQSIDQVFEGQ